MKKLIYFTMMLGLLLTFNACSTDDDEPDRPQTEQPDEPGTDPDNPNTPNPDMGKTLIVYYSFTNNYNRQNQKYSFSKRKVQKIEGLETSV